MSSYERTSKELHERPSRWLVTGAAGFIGSALVERLLELGQTVVGLDNFATGHQANLDDVRASVGDAWSGFRFLEGDIRDPDTCARACEGAEHVLHQAALGSVPRSIEDPLASHQANVDGFVNIVLAARDAGVGRLVYASSSSVYGDDPELPKVEHRTGQPLSPYAATKFVDEVYAAVFQRTYGIELVGLRYFNVFGRRQDPAGPYAAVIPRWIESLARGERCQIFGDGHNSRDFCYVDNAVQANILAATTRDDGVTDEVYNVGCGDRTTLNELYRLIRDRVARRHPEAADVTPDHTDPRPGDVLHSQADVAKIREHLGYRETHRIAEGLDHTVEWFLDRRS